MHGQQNIKYMKSAPTLQKIQTMSITSKIRRYAVCSIRQAQQKCNVLEERNIKDSSYLGRCVALGVNTGLLISP